MPLYQINYDLRSKSPDHGVVDKKIRQLFPGAVRALESTWLADHGGTPLDVANIMRWMEHRPDSTQRPWCHTQRTRAANAASA